MDAIDTLMNEHRQIERVIGAMIAFASDARRRGSTGREELRLFVAFLRRFADQLHHGKEEDILFRAMADHGFPTEGGPLAVMLAEHVRGRALIRALAGAAEGDGAWTDEDRTLVLEAATGYGALLRSHIHKEDAILYPMAEQHLPPGALAEVDRLCASFDRDPERAALHAEYEALAEDLVARHAPAARAEVRP